MVKKLPAMWQTRVSSLGQEDPLEKGTVICSSLAWRIPWKEKPGYSPWGRKESDTTEQLTHKDLEITLESINRYMAEDVVYAITDGP